MRLRRPLVTKETLTTWRAGPMGFLEDVLTYQDGTPLGERMDDWQREDYRAALTTPLHQWWERPRAHIKTEGLGGVGLTRLVTGPAGWRGYLSATDRDQAALAFDSLRGFVRRSPALRGLLRMTRSEVVFERMDSKLTVLAADAPGSWGLRPHFVGVDEFSQWRTPAHEEFFWSLHSSLGKVLGAQMLVATTAHWDRSGLCWRVREQILEDPAWHVSIRGQVASWIRPEFLAQQKRLLPAHLYQMLHLNVWTMAGAEFLTWAEIDACFDPTHAERPEPVPGARYFAGLDIGLTRDRTAFALVRAEGEAAVVDAIATWEGKPEDRVRLTEVEDVIVEAVRRFRPVELVVDPTEGRYLAERLRDRGLRVTEYRFSGEGRAALFDTLLQLVRGRRLRCFPHPALREELAGLRWTTKAGVLRPDHPASGHDDVVVATALAAQAFAGQPKPFEGSLLELSAFSPPLASAGPRGGDIVIEAALGTAGLVKPWDLDAVPGSPWEE